MFSFVYPEFIVLMLIPSLLLIYLVATNRSDLQKKFDQKLLEKLKIAPNALTKAQRNALLFASLILMMISLARPVLEGEKVSLESSGKSFAIALDISNSMMAKDIFPNRIKAAKEKAKELIMLNEGSEIALLAFSEGAFLVSPPTIDTSTLLYFLENLDTDTISHGSTNIASALKAALDALKSVNSKNLVLLSDGGDEKSFEKEIAIAKEGNLKVYVLNIGTKAGVPVEGKDGSFFKDENGNIAIIGMNEAIKELALQSGGGYVEYSAQKSDIKGITKELISSDKKSKEVVMLKELFYYPLGMAMFLLLLAFSSLPKKSGAIFVMLLVLPTVSRGGMLDFLELEKAKKAYEKGEYKESGQIYEKLSKSKDADELRFNLGNSHYKNREYEKALEQYGKIKSKDKELQAQALHNSGNAQMQLGKIDGAIKSYENSLELKEDADTKANLELAKKLKEQQQKNQNNNDEQKKENKQNNEEQNDANQDGGKGKEEEKKDEQQQRGPKNAQSSGMSDMEIQKWLNELDKNEKPTRMYNFEQKETQGSKKNPW